MAVPKGASAGLEPGASAVGSVSEWDRGTCAGGDVEECAHWVFGGECGLGGLGGGWVGGVDGR